MMKSCMDDDPMIRSLTAKLIKESKKSYENFNKMSNEIKISFDSTMKAFSAGNKTLKI